MQTTIFENIIGNENSFTELFKNFLKYKPFRDALLKKINLRNHIDKIAFDDITTQISLGKYGRPDIYILTDEVEVLIEIKIQDTIRTVNQPKGYLKYLTQSSKLPNRHLVFLTPKSYYGLSEYQNEIESSDVKKIIICDILFWEDIVQIIRDNELDAISPLYTEYIHFLDNRFNLTATVFTQKNIKMLFDKETPRAIAKLQALIYKIFQTIQNKGIEVNWYSDKEFEEYGFYIKFNDNAETDKLFFGMWFDYWQETGNPLCLGLKSNNIKKNHFFEEDCERLNMPTIKVFSKYSCTYFDQTKFTDNAIVEISRQVEELIKRLNIKYKQDE